MSRMVWAVFVMAGAAAGQSSPARARTVVRADSRLVVVPVTVTDRKGAVVNGLTETEFRVEDDKKRQRITSFSEEDVPCSVGVVFDLSGSMKEKLPEAKRALQLFFELAEPADGALLVTVAGEPGFRSGFTHDFTGLLAGLTAERGGGATALVDAIYAATLEVRKASHARRALLVISDGMDNHSRYTRAELTSLMMEADVEIHTLAVFERSANKKAMELQAGTRGLNFLEELSSRTGGLHFVVRDEKGMRDAAARVGKALRSQYLIGFQPSSALDRKRHSLRITLARPDARAHARAGYVSE